jgi:HAD superfamily hydrolase (TIGR01544 family)
MAAASSQLEQRVLLTNPELVEQRVQAFSQAAREGRLLVIADFDRTITKCFVAPGQRGTSGHGVLEATSVLSEEYMAYTKTLLDKYYPIEIDTNMSIEEKLPLMLEWYQQVHTRMLTENVTPDKIGEAVAACPSIVLREGMDRLIKVCQDATPPIPFIIMSAGLGNVIEEFFRQRLPFQVATSTYVHSNRLNFGGDGRLESFSLPRNRSCTCSTRTSVCCQTAASRCSRARHTVFLLAMAWATSPWLMGWRRSA